MGNYINPKEINKEDFLKIYSKYVTVEEAEQFDFSNDNCLLCWIDNGAFKSLIIIPDKKEYNRVTNPYNSFAKSFWMTSKKNVDKFGSPDYQLLAERK